jgi:hypothetical protein
MTVKSMDELLAQADATIEDNITGAITPSDVRTLIKNFIDSISPGYGAISAVSVVEAVTAVFGVIAPWAAQVAATAGVYTTNLTNGSVTRLIQSAALAGGTDFIVADLEVEGPNNNVVTVALFKNGVSTGFEMSATTQGAGRPVSLNLSGLVYTAQPGDAVYDLRAAGDATNYTFTNLLLLIQTQPVRSYV